MTRQALEQRLAQLEQRVAELQQTLAEKEARIAELQTQNAELQSQLHQRSQKYRPKANTKPRGKKHTDRRRVPHRTHGYHTRPEPPADAELIHHDVQPAACPFCEGPRLERTGEFEDHLQEEIPQPQVEWHRYRRHQCRCLDCGHLSKGRGDLELPGSHIGPRARLLMCYARGHLGTSLGKGTDLLREFFELSLSRAGALGHLKWGGLLFAPVVMKLWEILRNSPVVHADETGWRVNGQNLWAWCFSNPQLALYLIGERRNRAVLEKALGDSLPGVLVTDFYAVYNKIDCRKQKCLVHLLRDLTKLREELPRRIVKGYIQPWIALFQDAIALGKSRENLPEGDYAQARQTIHDRFDHLMLERTIPDHPDCRRLWKRLFKHCGELFTFLSEREVPSDNNSGERDIRSLVALRADGGTNRTDWGAKTLGAIKSVIRTCQKNGRSFFVYGMSLVRSRLTGQPPPLPCAAE
jgi:transposase